MFGKQSLKFIDKTTNCDVKLKVQKAYIDKEHVLTIRFNQDLLVPVDELYIGKAI